MGWIGRWWKVGWSVAAVGMAAVMGWSYAWPWGMVHVERSTFSFWVLSLDRGKVGWTGYTRLDQWEAEKVVVPPVVTWIGGGGSGASGSGRADTPRSTSSHRVVTGGDWLGIMGTETVEWSVPNGGGFTRMHGAVLREASLSLWWVVAGLAIGPAVGELRRAGRARLRRRAGLCVGCGYDLRGSGERCSECGLGRGEMGWWERVTERVCGVGAAGWVRAKAVGRVARRAGLAASWGVAVLGTGLWGVSWVQPTDVVWQWGRQCEVTVDRGRVEVRWAERFCPWLGDAMTAVEFGFAVDRSDRGFVPRRELAWPFRSWPRVYATCHVEGWSDWAPPETWEAGEEAREQMKSQLREHDDYEQWRAGPFVRAVRECWEDGWWWLERPEGLRLEDRGEVGAKALRVWVWGGALWAVVAAGLVWPVVAGVRRWVGRR